MTSRRTFVKAAAGIAAAGVCGSWIGKALATARGNTPLNVLFLMCDQHRPDAIGKYGDPYALTPAMDSLVADGMGLRQTYCQGPICVASRNSILTGRYVHSTGVLSNGYKANRSQISFAQVLRKQGYKTACFGKLHTPGREDLDWDVYVEGSHYPPGKVPPGGVLLESGLNAQNGNRIGAPYPFDENTTLEWRAKEDTIAFMKANISRPWLIQCSCKRPHPPFQPPKKYWDMIDRSRLQVPHSPPGDLKDCNPRYLESLRHRGMENLTDEQVRDGMQGYYGNLAFADAMFAQVLKALDDLGLRQNTLVIYTADHGEMLYEHRLWTKMVFFDPSVRVPLIVRLPEVVAAGKQSTALVESIDLFPTIMEFLGKPTPASVQGRSLAGLLTGKTDQHRTVVRSEFPNGKSRSGGYEPTMMQFDGRFKVVDNGPDLPPELYDHSTDPHEYANLHDRPEHKERLGKTIAELRAWVKQDVAPSQRKGGGETNVDE